MAEAPPPAALRLSVLNRIEALTPHLDKADAFLTAWGIDAADHAQVMIILDEIASNIIKSAWPDGDVHHFSLDLSITPEPAGLALQLIAIDDGLAFDPTEAVMPDITLDLDDREPGGLGLLMVQEMSDSVEYCRINGCNHLKVAKRLQQGE
jgi:anti-sigma regulatory factor (Ser/Thr protein kinase)